MASDFSLRCKMIMKSQNMKVLSAVTLCAVCEILYRYKTHGPSVCGGRYL